MKKSKKIFQFLVYLFLLFSISYGKSLEKNRWKGRFIIRHRYVKTEKKNLKINNSAQYSLKLRHSWNIGLNMNLGVGLLTSDPKKPYSAYNNLEDDFNWYLDQLFLKYKFHQNTFILGKFENPFSKTKTQLLFDNDVQFKGFNWEIKGKQSIYYDLGYLRLTEGKRTETDGTVRDADNTVLYLGIKRKNHNFKWRFTYWNYSISSENPFLIDDIRYNKYYAYGKKFELINFYLECPLCRKGDFYLEWIRNLKAISNNTSIWAAQAYWVGFRYRYHRLKTDIGCVKIEPNSLIGYYTSWGDQINSTGVRIKLDYYLQKKNSIRIAYNNFHKENPSFAGPFKRERRIMLMDIVKF